MSNSGKDLEFKIENKINSCIRQQSVAYIHSKECLSASDRLPRVVGRADMVHSLIQSYGLLPLMKIVTPKKASEEDITRFHSRHYIKTIQQLSSLSDDDDDKHALYETDASEYGLDYDCPVPQGLYDDLCLLAGASIQAAKVLNEGECKIAINWTGGWHHAKKDEASGFCYVNDIVLAILKLKEKYSNILYIDLDLHHGDGVQGAFFSTNQVMTVSFHHYSAGFYPGTGDVHETGICRGSFHTINVPIMEGAKDYEFLSLFTRIMDAVYDVYKPQAIVCQCGADGLSGDPMKCFNLSHQCLARCVYKLQQWDKPLLLLGGGGYNYTNTAICWTYMTGIVLNKKLASDIPDHRYFTKYGPSYELAVVPGNKVNHNNKAYLTDLFTKVMTYIHRLTLFNKEMSEKLSHHFRL